MRSHFPYAKSVRLAVLLFVLSAMQFLHAEALDKPAVFTHSALWTSPHQDSDVQQAKSDKGLLRCEEAPSPMANTPSLDWSAGYAGALNAWLHNKVDRIAWLAIVICVFYAVHASACYAKLRPHLAASLALFAVANALFLPYYSFQVQAGYREILNGLAGVLLVLAGGELRRGLADNMEIDDSSASQDVKHRIKSLSLIDRLGVSLLVPTAIGSLIYHIVSESDLLDHSSHEEWKNIMSSINGTILILLGFVSLYDGIRRLHGSQVLPMLFGVLVLYGCLEICQTGVDIWRFAHGTLVQNFFDPATKELSDMPVVLKLGFATARCLLTIAFTHYVIGLTRRYRDYGYRVFFGLH
jgi:hypothetical protein